VTKLNFFVCQAREAREEAEREQPRQNERN